MNPEPVFEEPKHYLYAIPTNEIAFSSGVTVTIDENKIEENKAWDGLKNYRTNTSLSAEEVYEAYQTYGMSNVPSV